MMSMGTPSSAAERPHNPAIEKLDAETSSTKNNYSTVTSSRVLNSRRSARWDKAVDNFLTTTSLHGMSHIRTSTRTQKRLWISVVSFCTFILIIQTSVLIYNTVNRPAFYTTLTLETRDEDIVSTDDSVPGFPGITICSLSPLKTTSFDHLENITLSLPEYTFLSLGFPYVSVSMEKRLWILEKFLDKKGKSSMFEQEMAARKKEFNEAIKANELFQYIVNNSHNCPDVFRGCLVSLESIDCCDLFQPVLTNMGLCFKLDNSKLIETDVTATIPINIDLNYIDNNGYEYENGFYILIYDHRTNPRFMFLQDGTLVTPGTIANIRIASTRIDYSEKYTKWLGMKTECPKSANSSKTYNKVDCVLRVAAEEIKRFCNCNWILSFEPDSIGTNVCGPVEMTDCALSNINEIFRSTAECRIPCIEYFYDAEISTAELTQKREKRRSRLSISYNGRSFFHNIYHRYYLSSLFSDIGGATGLLLGASAITGIEALIFLWQWFYWNIICRL